jgi:hypothetical protein
MRWRDIPTDIAISAAFIGVFLLAFIPGWIAIWSPDLLLAIKAARVKLKEKPPRSSA